ncbi:redoxin domain-containing protein [Rubrobacter marinus]|uniref:Redoxin domain-containing protein n=1 Tax=Rubrobacter marinus TaxID=2653852 RepID=A0A6G8PYQ1_9ACTN|nr:redoxin domain-containing protein [Rubrobacter marinus]QIN79341.1 redoxin domain-containing protein [Rubrobacter marinus]
MARTKTAGVPEVGAEAPEFNLPSAQGGQLRLSMRTARGPVILVFYGEGDEEDVRYFGELAALEDEINMAGGTVVGIGVSEPDAAREFLRKSGLKSYVLYDYARSATRAYGLLEGRKSDEHARPAAFVIGGDHKIAHAWTGERPEAAELLRKVSEITGLPKPAEEPEADDAGEKRPAARAPKEAPEGAEKAEGEAAAPAAEAEKPKKMSAEERERIKAERRAARAEGKSLKQPNEPSGDGAAGEAPAAERKRLSPEEREKRRAERKAAREAGDGAKPEAGGGANGDAGEAGKEG